MTIFVYCEKCGRVYKVFLEEDNNFILNKYCDVCSTKMKTIPEGYDMSWDTWWSQYNVWESNRDRLLEEVVKKSPEYDPELYEQRDGILEEQRKRAHKIYGKCFKNDKNPENIKCPYCGSYLVKKIGAGSRLLSVGLLGFGSSKIGKQWHCENCKSDF